MKDEQIILFVALLGTALVFGGVANANESNEPLVGYLNIINKLQSNPGNIDAQIARDTEEYLPGATDGWDGAPPDGIWMTPPGDRPSIFFDIGGTRADLDASNEQSKKSYPVWLVYNGVISQDTSNWLEFLFHQWPEEPLFVFKDITGEKYQPILFQSDRLPYGPTVDVRRAINQNSGVVSLIPLSAGSYSPSSAYDNTGIVTIGTRLLADLDDSNQVNFEDFAIWAEDWQKGPGQYVGDICGPNGIPDSNVDGYDLMAFGEDWLKDANDPNTW